MAAGAILTSGLVYGIYRLVGPEEDEKRQNKGGNNSGN